MNYRKIPFVLTCAMTLALAACSSVPMAEVSADSAAKKLEAPSEGTANVYVISSGGSALNARGFVGQVTVGGVNKGGLAYKTYQVYSTKPGQTNVVAFIVGTQAVVKLNAAAGKNYFVQLKTNLLGAVGLEQISEVAARQLLQQCALAEGL